VTEGGLRLDQDLAPMVKEEEPHARRLRHAKLLERGDPSFRCRDAPSRRPSSGGAAAFRDSKSRTQYHAFVECRRHVTNAVDGAGYAVL
jgi:hypothetical protein